MVAKKIRIILEKALRESGEFIRESAKKPLQIDYKGPVNIVTQVDKNAEKLIVKIIKKEFPDHSILAEESEPSGNSTSKWIIDPIDGTTNFAHALPASCVSIGYEENGIVVLGGVWNPFINELFWAERGKGATLNGKKIRVSKIKNLLDSLLATGFPYDRRDKADYYLNFIKAFMMKSQGIRRLGSSAIDTCYVACGRFDAYWEFKLKPWDIAAASLIAKEAGATLTDFTGKPYSIYGSQTLVSNGLIHKEMIKILKTCL